MSRFSLFKKLVPATLLTVAPTAFADSLGTKQCHNLKNQFGLQFNEVTFTITKDTAFFDYVKSYGVEYSSGSTVGHGSISDTALELELVYTRTGSQVKNNVGYLVGKKVKGEWQFELTPWNPETESYEEKAVKLSYCQSR